MLIKKTLIQNMIEINLLYEENIKIININVKNNFFYVIKKIDLKIFPVYIT